jgi:cysteine desulfurase
MTSPLYFDNHATTPVDPRVLEAMLPFFKEQFGNPVSVQHAYGWQAKLAVDTAREQIANLIGARSQEIIFTSGATESIALAILGTFGSQGAGHHFITSNAEHKATLETFSEVKKRGGEVTILPVDRFGVVTAKQVEAALKPNTVLVSLMHANNEVGSFNPIGEIGPMLKTKGVIFHVDAAQSAGKNPIDVDKMGIELLSISAHKLYGPKGVGCLYVRKSDPLVHLTALFSGGGQEHGLRGGTLNVPGIVGLGKACDIALKEMELEGARLKRMRDHIVQAVTSKFAGVSLNGHPTERLCNNVNITIKDVDGDRLYFDLKDVAYSSASACSGGAPSHVLEAIGHDPASLFSSTLRFGLGRFTTDAEVAQLLEKLSHAIENARAVSKSYADSLKAIPKK